MFMEAYLYLKGGFYSVRVYLSGYCSNGHTIYHHLVALICFRNYPGDH